LKIRDIIDYLRSDMTVIVRNYIASLSTDVYSGEVQNMPYWVAEESFTAAECIEAEKNTLVIEISPPAGGKAKDSKTNQDWLDTLSEEEVLLYLAGLLYHYDVGTIHNESYCESEWEAVFSPMIDYVEKRLGSISYCKKISDWFKAKSSHIKK
jgi:hypothetical protein